MTKFHTIDIVNEMPFLVSWDLGRRCNYNCSYCPPHRHDKTSVHASLEELKTGADFVFEYVSLILKHKNYKTISISFTGGEPTVNPEFINFSRYVKELYHQKYSDQFKLILDLTTNGAMSKKTAIGVLEIFDHVTVSYHTEEKLKTKEQSLNRIYQLFEGGMDLKVNVMLHAEHFDECKTVMEELGSRNISYIPRSIGEEPNSKFAHKYTQEQINWFQTFWGESSQNTLTGRPCCGGRSFTTCGESGIKEVKFINNRNFQNWYCSVNWYFLHIEQQTDSVYHHQTCQARFDGTRGPIGKISKGTDIIENLKHQLLNNSMPTIICPNNICGCGLCTPKSKNKDDYFKIIGNTVDTSILYKD
jgi:MoaA/NifB/PqqE/SkfB family radical SAM enzyme